MLAFQSFLKVLIDASLPEKGKLNGIMECDFLGSDFLEKKIKEAGIKICQFSSFKKFKVLNNSSIILSYLKKPNISHSKNNVNSLHHCDTTQLSVMHLS